MTKNCVMCVTHAKSITVNCWNSMKMSIVAGAAAFLLLSSAGILASGVNSRENPAGKEGTLVIGQAFSPGGLEKEVRSGCGDGCGGVRVLEISAGTLSAEDCRFIRENMVSLEELTVDSEASFVDGTVPKGAFCGMESLRKINDELKRYTPAERRKLFRLKPDRAEVIVPAAEIFLEVARCGQSKEIWVPMIGLADGIIDSLYAKRLKAKR